jgi:hydrogenase expression/formation protein HypE
MRAASRHGASRARQARPRPTPAAPVAAPACPLPAAEPAKIQLAHGGGGRLTHRLIRDVFAAAFDNPALAPLHDGAFLDVAAGRIAVTTDGFVVTPRFFPGGDIGALSVYGTVNDLAMCAARPLALAAGFVLEEGLALDELLRIVQSMRRAADLAGVAIVTGDTKVVDRGKGDGVFIHTTGFGRVAPGIEIAPGRARPGDVVLVSGRIAEHGIAILSVREGLEFETTLESDAAPLHELVAGLLAAVGPAVHVLRDPTRGGVSSALNEIAEAAGAGIALDEAAIPIAEQVRGACEILGLDPLYVANEGKALAIVAREAAEAALAALRAHPLGRDAAAIGEVVGEHPGRVVLRGRVGGTRIVDLLSGEQLPRIC